MGFAALATLFSLLTWLVLVTASSSSEASSESEMTKTKEDFFFLQQQNKSEPRQEQKLGLERHQDVTKQELNWRQILDLLDIPLNQTLHEASKTEQINKRFLKIFFYTFLA